MATVEKTAKDLAKMRYEQDAIQQRRERDLCTLDGDKGREALDRSFRKERELRREAEEEAQEVIDRG